MPKLNFHHALMHSSSGLDLISSIGTVVLISFLVTNEVCYISWLLTLMWYLGYLVCIESWLIINHRYWIIILAIAGQGAIVC